MLAFKTEGTTPIRMRWCISPRSITCASSARGAGDQLILEAEIVRTIRNIWKFRGCPRRWRSGDRS